MVSIGSVISVISLCHYICILIQTKLLSFLDRQDTKLNENINPSWSSLSVIASC